MTETPQEESDQLPEDAQPEAVPEDDATEARKGATENPGVPGEDDTNTGHPDNAGADT
jgi:hypothetical protein